MMRTLLSRLHPEREAGASLLIVIMVIALLGALGTTAAVMSVSNLKNTSGDRQAGDALNVSEGGIAQAISYIQYQGVGTLACSPRCNPANGQPDWGQGPNTNGAGPNTTIAANASYGHVVTLATGENDVVWIQVDQAFNPPTVNVGTYTIHSTAKAKATATLTGTRSLSVDVTVKPVSFPIGVFGHQVEQGGTPGIHYESEFSDGCITGRDHMSFQGTDAYYGIPAAAHSAGYIGEKQNFNCTAGNGIHQSGPCNTTYPYDSDFGGGSLANTSCYGAGGTFKGSPWLTTSQETSASAMASFYGYNVNTQGLSNTDLDALRTAAQQQGFYYTSTTAIPAVLQSTTAYQTYPHPVLFYDLKGAAVGGSVDLSDLKGYSRAYPVASTSAQCTPYGAVVVVLNGNVKLNANTVLVASVFAPGPSPNGVVSKANGTGQLIGTLFAQDVQDTGTADIYLDSCFLANLPGGLLSVKASNFREEDR